MTQEKQTKFLKLMKKRKGQGMYKWMLLGLLFMTQIVQAQGEVQHIYKQAETFVVDAVTTEYIYSYLSPDVDVYTYSPGLGIFHHRAYHGYDIVVDKTWAVVGMISYDTHYRLLLRPVDGYGQDSFSVLIWKYKKVVMLDDGLYHYYILEYEN